MNVARLYNAVISSIIEGATGWHGYRNIIANMGIGLDGSSQPGRDVEQFVKGRIRWSGASAADRPEKLRRNGRYTKPDIQFQLTANDETALVATIEIKGGKDAAGALERLGAVQKSFEETPPNCANFLIAGIITPEMAQRLDTMGSPEDTCSTT